MDDSVDRMKSLVLEMYERLVNRRDLDAAGDYFMSDVRVHGGYGEEYEGLEDMREFLQSEFDAFSEASLTVEDLIGEGDRVVARYIWVGTHTGDVDQLEATGIRAQAGGITIFRFEGDFIAEEWEVFDEAGLLRQLESRTTAHDGTN